MPRNDWFAFSHQDDEGAVRLWSNACSGLPSDALGAGVIDAGTAHSLALAWLDDHRTILGKPFATVPLRLRPGAFKKVEPIVVVGFEQEIEALPVWQAGLAVRIDIGRRVVTGVSSALQCPVNRPVRIDGAPYAPEKVDPATLQARLGVSDPPRIHKCRSLFYCFRREKRLHAGAAHIGSATHAYPHLALQPLPADVPRQGTHIQVTEVLFAWQPPHGREVNWRAFLHPVTGVVLYLRVLVAGMASALVFPCDPETMNGGRLAAGAPALQFNRFRASRTLRGLLPPSGGQQELSGEFVKLVDTQVPNLPLPRTAEPYEFDFDCDCADFAACSAYYHCDEVFRWVASLGINLNAYFTNTRFPIEVDPHAFGGALEGQAVADPDGSGVAQFLFGAALPGTQFGAAIDRRIVLHEFGHAVLLEHLRSPNLGFAHSVGDSLAAIAMDPESLATDPGETYPFIPGVDRRHDRDVLDGWGWFGLHNDGEYGSEQILSTTLYRLYQAMGGARGAPAAQRLRASRHAVRLILTAVAMLQFKTPDPADFMAIMAEADAAIDYEGDSAGALGKVIRWAFEMQGLPKPGSGLVAVGRAPAPPVDLYVDDGQQGEYLPLRDAVGAVHGVWNRQAPDGLTENQPPQPGVPNFAYVRVRNRGQQAATAVHVALHRDASALHSDWPTGWTTVGAVQLPSVGPLGEEFAGPFAWTPGVGTNRLLAEVDHPGDPSLLTVLQPSPMVPVAVDRFVRLDNNLGQRIL